MNHYDTNSASFQPLQQSPIGPAKMSHLRVSRSVMVCCSIALGWQLHAQGTERGGLFWKGKSGNYAIESSAEDLKATRADNGRLVFDAAADAKAAWAGFVRNSNGAPMEAEFTYRLLSAVGPYLSLEEGSYCDCGGAHPAAMKRFQTIELEAGSHESGSPAALTDIFPEHTVLAALIADPVIAKTLTGAAKPDSMAGLLQTLLDKTVKLKDCEYRFPEDLLSSFAFYDTEDGSVSVRLSLPSAVEVCRGQMIQLGLTLPIPEARRAWFLNAKDRRDGLLMADVARRSSVISFKFSQRGQGAKSMYGRESRR